MRVPVLLILLIWFCQAGPARHPSRLQPSHSAGIDNRKISPQRSFNHTLSCRIIPAPGNTYGYRIYLDGRLYIDQPHRPALPGNQGFASEADARKVARLVMFKIRNGEIPPGVSVEELIRLKVVK